MPRRRQHREISVADSETDPFKFSRVPEPFVWGWYNGSEYQRFDTTDEFIAFVRDRKSICYAHNGGRFDWHFIADYFEELDEIVVISGRIAKFKIGECEFRDSFCILPVALGDYQKDEIDYAIFEASERNKPHNKILIDNYLKSDCRYLWNLVNEYIERYGVKLTLAGSAMHVWQKEFATLDRPKSTKSFYADFAPFYYGGRVEVFKAGKIEHPFKVLDINSAYPFAMLHQHPYGNVYDVTDELPASDDVVTRCFIRLNTVARGCFPYRDKHGLNFPNDDVRREYCVTGWEYLAALGANAIDDVEILEVRRFYEQVNFVEYVNHFYEMKNKAKASNDKESYTFAKLFLNSLYGKMAANPDNYEKHMICERHHIEALMQHGYEFAGIFGKWAVMETELSEHEKQFYNVATAASITGFVRAYLFQSMQQCEGLLYCDTDSLVATSAQGLPLGDQLGEWDIEGECTEGAICGKKLYALKTAEGWKIASKGGKLSHKEIYDIAAGNIITWNNPAPTFSFTNGTRFISRRFGMTA